MEAAQAMTAVSVIVPWRPTPDRAPLWTWLRPRWEALGYQVVEGDCDPGPWVKAAAVAAALTRATGEVLVVADADVWCDGVVEAVRAVVRGAPWAVPGLLVHRLAAEMTVSVLAGGGWPDGPWQDPATRAAYVQRPYRCWAGGGITVLRRDLYRRIPLDPRFGGWGHEDGSWGHALTVLLGPEWRGTAPLWHLWHQPAPERDGGRGAAESVALERRYRAACAPAEVRAILDEIYGRHSSR